jgi:uncharacterized protein YebE (UPF0316 family)
MGWSSLISKISSINSLYPKFSTSKLKMAVFKERYAANASSVLSIPAWVFSQSAVK